MSIQIVDFSEVPSDNKPYQPFGASEEVLYAREDEVIVDGPAGTGKSRGVLEKLNLCALKYPGMRGLIVRKTRESLTQSAMVTFDSFVVPNNGAVRWRTSEQEYRYSNGSKIVVGGMDKASKIMSTDYDIIYVQEMTELTEEEWETLTTRARYGLMPFNQVIGDCNPAGSSSWVKRRWESKKARRIKSVHQDNPKLYDHLKQEWTAEGANYLRKLQNLSGVRNKRLYLGLWESSEGQVFEGYDAYHHLIDPFPIPEDWTRFRVVDFGFTNPFVCQWWAIDPDGRLYLYREIYMTRRTVRAHSAQIKELSEDENIQTTVCDWDAEDRATLEENGIETEQASKEVRLGIEAVQERLKIQEDGKARLYYFRDSLVERDEELEDRKLPLCTTEEIEGYVWNNRKEKDEPIKRDDHGCDGTRYASRYADESTGNGGIFL